MADAGQRSEFAASGKVAFSNNTDSLDYVQLENISFDIETTFTKEQLSNNTLEKLTDLRDWNIEADITLTTPDIAPWVTLTVQTNNQLPSKEYYIVLTPESGSAVTISGSFYLAIFRTIDTGIGTSRHHIRLESVDGAVTLA